MGLSKSEEQNQERIKSSIDKQLNGKRIDQYAISPKKQYIATFNKEDKSLCVWTIRKDLTIEYENSLNIKSNSHLRSSSLAGISDCKHIILTSGRYIYGSGYYGKYDFEIEIIDTITKSRQKLRARGLTEYIAGHIASISFLENGDLAIVKGKPVYRTYIFAKSKSNGKHQWTCKKSFELGKFYFCTIDQNRKLFVLNLSPSFVIMQWDLITQKFDKQYMLFPNSNLDHDCLVDLQMKLNSDSSLFAITYEAYAKYEDRRVSFCNVYVYSTKTGRMIANRKFDEGLHNFCFIGSKEKERLLFSGPNYEKKSYNFYILNPYKRTLDKSSENDVLQDIYAATFENYKSIGSINIIFDYIIKNDNNQLSIQKLSQNEIWKNYLERTRITSGKCSDSCVGCNIM
ncbi:hypothetical protein C2G38_2139706 [Gigaspora rosea]|uniref:Uncharacterized protein n=1 Tax=Gigaspora rosea TaxID=44941 RepID=A0A397VNQ6_9GLOM|nr:hypothetical protein C2G38_2139706 [Gigaspora rosea]